MSKYKITLEVTVDSPDWDTDARALIHNIYQATMNRDLFNMGSGCRYSYNRVGVKKEE